MAPTLRPGDACLVRYGTTVRPGVLVVARLPARPLGVKRAADHDLDGWWLSSDNPAAGTDSATFGRVADEDVLGRVVARYWPRPAWFRASSSRARSYQARQSA
jgi:phage repressor protein C with HTH and peptisase S24 domain